MQTRVHVRNLIFVGGMSSAQFYPEERRFVEELSVHFDRMVYLNGIGLRGLRLHQVSAIVRRLRRTSEKSEQLQHLEHRTLLIVPERKVMQLINIKWLRSQLRRLAHPAPGEWAIWIRFPSKELVAAIEGIPFSRVVYEPIDPYADHPSFSRGERKRVLAAEARLTQRATVIASARTVSERLGIAGGGCYWLPLGMDELSQASDLGLPDAIGRPRLLVIGSLDWRIDQRLIAQIAQSHPEWQLVLAGPQVVKFNKDVKAFRNIHFLGPIPTDRAASVIADCDVALIPYCLTDWTRASLPLKAFDYLSSGKPVVSTALPELSVFGDVVDAVPPSEFVSRIEQVLENDSAESARRRRERAGRFTIQSRASRAIEILAEERLKTAPH